MKPHRKMILGASAGLAAALFAVLPGAAFAQEADASEITEIDEEPGEEIVSEDEGADVEVEPEVAEDEAGLVAPPADTTADDAAAEGGKATGEPELITPGSTDESNPGGSTRPGTTPDN